MQRAATSSANASSPASGGVAHTRICTPFSGDTVSTHCSSPTQMATRYVDMGGVGAKAVVVQPGAGTAARTSTASVFDRHTWAVGCVTVIWKTARCSGRS